MYDISISTTTSNNITIPCNCAHSCRMRGEAPYLLGPPDIPDLYLAAISPER